MPAGDIVNNRVAITTIQTLDAALGAGAKTYSYAAIRAIAGVVFIGNSGLTAGNGMSLPSVDDDPLVLNAGTIIGANINVLGPGVFDFFGITSA